MKLPITKDWLEKRAAAEGDLEIGAGRRLTKTLNLTPDELADLERLVNPDREAIRAQAFEEAALVAEAEPEFEEEPGPEVVKAMLAIGPIKNARTACSVTKASIAKAIRALATTTPANGGTV
ncbi:hypothetical protein [Shinella sp. M31]|uniref:hypothetical protein n=1 Tax=Shinella sp. M31 TaxID=3368615 RepID=UPI003BA2D6FC